MQEEVVETWDDMFGDKGDGDDGEESGGVPAKR
jgi:hypothetical protein